MKSYLLVCFVIHLSVKILRYEYVVIEHETFYMISTKVEFTEQVYMLFDTNCEHSITSYQNMKRYLVQSYFMNLYIFDNWYDFHKTSQIS